MFTIFIASQIQDLTFLCSWDQLLGISCLSDIIQVQQKTKLPETECLEQSMLTLAIANMKIPHHTIIIIVNVCLYV